MDSASVGKEMIFAEKLVDPSPFCNFKRWVDKDKLSTSDAQALVLVDVRLVCILMVSYLRHRPWNGYNFNMCYPCIQST